uniref:imidazole glycerol-phosphate synthase n=1 Tax=Proboscia inermis TaxID=420281 RepID=A0A7S0C295_9STRA
MTSTEYGGVRYVSAIQKGNVVAMQFHPEKSGQAGLNIIQGFLEAVQNKTLSQTVPLPTPSLTQTYPQLVKRVVVALDVRTNDSGDLVVTKGDQYDVREKDSGETTEASGRGNVRNLGKPVSLAERYYNEGADEIAFLNITSFRGGGVLEDAPMLQVLEAASEHIFVPLTVGGGIRSYVGQGGVEYSALEVASRYFRAGADKISIGSDAVYAAEAYWKQKESGGERNTTSLEAISQVYGVQAVVVSIDPKRVYLSSSDVPDSKHTVLTPTQIGPNGETSCYYQCTVKGGREKRPIDAIALARAAEALGAGEIMLNCIDMDGTCSGYDLVLMNAVCDAVSIPVIASSGAGTVEHFGEVFEKTKVKAALAAGMFHRKEVGIDEVKSHMEGRGLPTRRTA